MKPNVKTYIESRKKRLQVLSGEDEEFVHSIKQDRAATTTSHNMMISTSSSSGSSCSLCLSLKAHIHSLEDELDGAHSELHRSRCASAALMVEGGVLRCVASFRMLLLHEDIGRAKVEVAGQQQMCALLMNYSKGIMLVSQQDHRNPSSGSRGLASELRLAALEIGNLASSLTTL